MSRYETFDRSRLQRGSLEERGCDVWKSQIAELASPEQPLDSAGLCSVALAIRKARQNDKPVVAMIGGHPIKLGLSRFLIDLMEQGFVTHLATNGAGLIHEFELFFESAHEETSITWSCDSRTRSFCLARCSRESTACSETPRCSAICR
jgi:hypothetical protein